MSDGKKLIASILETGSVETLRQVDVTLFEDSEVGVFNFVRQHYRRYHELPSFATVEAEERTRLPQAPEATAYYLRRLYDRRLFQHFREGFEDLRGALRDMNVDGAREIIDRMKSQSRVATPQDDLRNIREAAESVLAQYEVAHENPGVNGITTGWPFLDTITGGYQNGDLVAWVARMGVGKCMAPHTPVMRSDGTVVRIDSLRVGDTLMGPDSAPRTVYSTTTGREEMFRVVPQHGDAWECNRSHILSLVCANTTDKTHVKGQKYLYSVHDFLALPSRVRDNLRLWRAAVDFPAKPTTIDPYFVGLWLGDGTRGWPRISTADAEIVDYLKSFANSLGMRLEQYEKREGFCKQYGVVDTPGRDNFVVEYVRRRCERGGEKRIPDEMMRNSREVRLATLAGLIDSDGCLEASGHYEIITKYPGLRDDILYLARTLGFGTSTGVKEVNDCLYYRVRIRPDVAIPVKLPRKMDAQLERRSCITWSSFSLTSLGEGDYFGITLDKDSLYLLGDCTVTHNTYALIHQAQAARRNGHSVLFVTMEMTIAQIMRRMMALDVRISPDFIRKGMLSSQAHARLLAYVETLAGVDKMMFYSGQFSAKLGDVDLVMAEVNADINYVDGAYLMQPDTVGKNANRIEKVGEVFNGLKRMTITHNRPIVTSTQFSRQAGKRGKDGSLENISFSDTIAQNSSLVFGLKEGEPPYQTSRRAVDLLKGREGESGTFEFNYRFDPMDFSEVAAEQAAAEAVDMDWMG